MQKFTPAANLKIITVVDHPQWDKKVFAFTCSTDNKEYFTCNEATARFYLDKENGIPSEKNMHRVKVNSDGRVVGVVEEKEESVNSELNSPGIFAKK